VRHAVLGSGGIGGLVAAALARGGADVVLLMRPETLARYAGTLAVESAVLGDFEIAVSAASELDREVDAVWVATKASGLAAALELAPPDRVGSAAVVPLLNGVDHVAVLRTRYGNVVPAAIRVESERVADGRIRQASSFARVELARGAGLAADLEAGGIACRIRDDEVSLLWEKLAFLAPVALATTALDGTLGAVRDDPRYRQCQAEALAVARAEGAVIDEDGLRALAAGAAPGMRSSMQKDVEGGRPPELDAIAGPIIRAGGRHGIDVEATAALVRLIEARI
jgi:2-dehydropantoate 2-reductase